MPLWTAQWALHRPRVCSWGPRVLILEACCQGTSEPFLVAKSLKAIKIITAVPVLGFTRPSEPQGISGHHRLFEAWKGLNSGSSSGVRLFSIKFYLPLCQRTGSFLFL